MERIVVAGHICVDLTPLLTGTTSIVPGALTEVGAMTVALGGCVANTGGDLHELGIPVSLIGTIGDDELGATLQRLLERQNLTTAGLTTVAGASTSYSLVLQPDGADRAFWHHPGANDSFDGSAVDVANCSLLHVGYPPLLPALLPNDGEPLRLLFERARRAGATTSLDLAVVDPRSRVARLDWGRLMRAVLPVVDVFSPSLDDLTSALRIDEAFSTHQVEELAERSIGDGAAIVMISAGSAGMYFASGSAERLATGGRVVSALDPDWADQRFWQPALAVADIVTTNGTGDAATAGLLYALWTGLGPRRAAIIAASSAAVAMTGAPTRREAVLSIADSNLGDT